MVHFWETAEFSQLKEHAARCKQHSLKELLADEGRTRLLNTTHDGIFFDGTRQLIDRDAWKCLTAQYETLEIPQRIKALFAGEKINSTEKRAVLHPALRSQPGDTFSVDGKDVVKDVQEVLQRIKKFSDDVRSGAFKGHTGKTLKNVVCVGIGGSYLGVEFVYEAIRTYKPATEASKDRTLRFLANVDPVDVTRALQGLDLEETLVVVISKTFTTAETMLNARTVKNALLKHYNNDTKAIAKHVCAVSTNLSATEAFGISSENVFGFWDWVGGRFSVCSAVGVLPLALQFGFDIVRQFLDGAREIDQHFQTEPMHCKNIPVMMALLSVWNATFLGHGDVAVLPYCQALLRFPAHIQQLTMESNGKRVAIDGTPLPCSSMSGEVYFGEPGTNGQHSFYQLIHQGRVVPCEFIACTKSQTAVDLDGEPVSNHDELMSNFFAQPDALALGKTEEQLRAEGCPAGLISHKTFCGNRPSSCLLFNDELTPYRVGQLLAIYEHRTAVEGFLWGVNSFDQWGVELGKVLAKDIRTIMANKRKGEDIEANKSKLPLSTQRLLNVYFTGSPN